MDGDKKFISQWPAGVVEDRPGQIPFQVIEQSTNI